jgi:hypothetical protein
MLYNYPGSMGSQKQREQRQVMMLNARLRSQDGWSSITVCNVSPRGLMAKSSSPAPPKGAFVELCRGTVVIVGHVRWSQGTRFGIRSQDRIDIAALTDEPGGGSAERRARERREAVRTRPLPKAVPTEERSRNVARMFDWGMLAFIGIVGAGFVGQQVYSALAAPLEQVHGALDASQR